MIKFTLPLLCLASLAACVGDEVKHLMIDDANLIQTMQGYVMNSALLAQNGLKTVTVRGDNILIISPNCQQTMLTRQQLMSTPNLENLLSRTKMELASAESGRPQISQGAGFPSRSGVAQFSLNDQMLSNMFSGRNINSQSFISNGWSMVKFGDNNVWLRRPNMQNNINRIHLSNDLVTFIYNGGDIQMKPIACLPQGEQQLVQQVRAELQQAHGQFNQNMGQFQQNMQNMHQNIHQNIQNMQMRMQQNMRNMNLGLPNMFGASQNGYNNALSRFGSQQQAFAGPTQMGQMQMPGMMQQNHGHFGPASATAAAASAGYPGATSFASSGLGGAFGQDFPFGPNNNPFGQGFPFVN